MLELGAEPGGNAPDDFARQIAAEIEKWKKVVAATGVKAE
jgi:tripartite-type tricarboxylate transporter receptor subunit TctC